MARVNVMLPDDLLGQIDHVAEQEGVNRSKLLRLAVMAYLTSEKIPKSAKSGAPK